MDIEGSEIHAIRGAKEIIKNSNINLAIASYHVVNGTKTCFEVERLFQDLGYISITTHEEHLTTYAFKD